MEEGRVVMRVMAVDYGLKRTGVAVSDVSRSIPGDTFTIEETCSNKLANRVEAEVFRRGVNTVVLGYPLNMNGTAGARAEETEKFKTMLERRGLNVILRDERRTTVEAQEILHSTGKHGKKLKSRVDAVAASLILEGFLLEEQLAKPDQGGEDGEAYL
jgi:putative Holliday junction resolvase